MCVRNVAWWILRNGVRTALCLLLVSSFAPLGAQSAPTRTRGAELTGFGMYTFLTPGYSSSQPNSGMTVGGDFTKLFKFTSLSLEFRYKNTAGVNVGESTLGFGPRLEYRWTRVHLYADFLTSAGIITFANKLSRGSFGEGYNGSIVYTYGGGLDYDVSGALAVRFDYQDEHWNLNENPPIVFFPNAMSVGVVYRLRFPHDRSHWDSGWNR
jgi:hypothetical protein